MKNSIRCLIQQITGIIILESDSRKIINANSFITR